jgi:APA family basic amino acid/polyamine antiporter
MQLKTVIGPVQLIFYSVGVIIGAGVYSVIGAAAGLAGHSLWLSFLVGAVVAALTAVSYAEMTTAFPAAGAEYVYIRHALPNFRWISYIVAVVILVGGAATAATVAVAFGGYLRIMVNVPQSVSSLVLIVVCGGIIVWGLREASWVNVLFTSIEVAGLLLVIVAGPTRDDFAAPLLLSRRQSRFSRSTLP